VVLMEDKNNFGYRKPDRSILSELSEQSEPSAEINFKYDQRTKPASVLDQMIEIQKIINKDESDLCAIMSTPAGARLLDWSYAVRGTWWYRLFSRIDGSFKKRIARLS